VVSIYVLAVLALTTFCVVVSAETSGIDLQADVVVDRSGRRAAT